MLAVAKAATEEEVAVAARYFSAPTPRSAIQVVETSSVPRTVASRWALVREPAGGTEPIGSRIVEIAEDRERFELRDDHARIIAYVPMGSIKPLRGTSTAPRLLGLSPSDVARQLYDFTNGARGAANAVQMRAVAYNLGEEDVVRIAAYLGSIGPRRE